MCGPFTKLRTHRTRTATGTRAILSVVHSLTDTGNTYSPRSTLDLGLPSFPDVTGAPPPVRVLVSPIPEEGPGRSQERRIAKTVSGFTWTFRLSDGVTTRLFPVGRERTSRTETSFPDY